MFLTEQSLVIQLHLFRIVLAVKVVVLLTQTFPLFLRFFLKTSMFCLKDYSLTQHLEWLLYGVAQEGQQALLEQQPLR
jgi:hypothetical protein